MTTRGDSGGNGADGLGSSPAPSSPAPSSPAPSLPAPSSGPRPDDPAPPAAPDAPGAAPLAAQSDPAGGPVRIARRIVPPGGTPWTWHHLERDRPGAAAWLAGRGLSEQVIEGLLDEATRPRLARAPGGHLVILRVRGGADAGTSGIPTGAGRGLRLWIGEAGVISLAAGELPEIETASTARLRSTS